MLCWTMIISNTDISNLFLVQHIRYVVAFGILLGLFGASYPAPPIKIEVEILAMIYFWLY